ncbi:hypothetical protein RB195_001463 [Necator americanus]|uniref:Uncharacterized protein n=1 Tax=Necator americanus TaxID=51031 RepID=A0ABR1DFL9_NECAM
MYRDDGVRETEVLRCPVPSNLSDHMRSFNFTGHGNKRGIEHGLIIFASKSRELQNLVFAGKVYWKLGAVNNGWMERSTQVYDDIEFALMRSLIRGTPELSKAFGQ